MLFATLHPRRNYDGAINADDYALIDSNSVRQGDPFQVRPAIRQTPSLVAVPEPTLGVVLLAWVGFLPRNRIRMPRRG
jgi:hypothetical protein